MIGFDLLCLLQHHFKRHLQASEWGRIVTSNNGRSARDVNLIAGKFETMHRMNAKTYCYVGLVIKLPSAHEK